MKTTFFFFLSLIITFGYSQSLQVNSLQPTVQSLIATPEEAIVITFNEAVNITTVNENTFLVFGRWSGVMSGEISFSNSDTVIRFLPNRPFFYGEQITVRLTSSIENNTSNSLTNGFAYNYWIKTLPASLNVTIKTTIPMRLNGETFIQCYGAYAGDVNNDEYSDLTVINENSNDIRVLLNDGTGNYNNFTVFDMPNANKPSTNEGADFNHDGITDLAIGSTQNNNTSIFIGNTNTIFEDEIGYEADNGVRGLTVLDFNGDGWDDIATANRIASNISLLTNDGTGNFNTAINIDTGVSSETAIVAADLNNDGFIDLIVGGYTSDNIVTLLNDGTGNFTITDVTSISGSPWMITAGDFNNDSNVDIASANSSSSEVSILFGDGNGNLTLNNEYSVGAFPLAIDVGDIDGDGDLDFISSNFSGTNFTLYENDGTGNYINQITYPSVQAGSCTILHDRDNNGSLDITFIDEIADLVILYDNDLVLNINDIVVDELSIYPNPFNDNLYLSKIINTKVTIKIYDLLGRLIVEESVVNTQKIDLSNTNLKEGFYLVELSYNKIKNYSKLYKK